MRKTKFLIAALLIGLPGMVSAQEVLTDGILRPDDLRRLQGVNDSAGQALREAFATGQSDDLNILADALSGTPLAAEESMKRISGEWSCKMIKLGKNLPIVVYSDFACVISDDGRFEKTSGSQRTKGKIYLDQDRLIYLGTGFIAGDNPPDYSDLPAEVSPQDDPQRMPEVGVIEMTGEDKGRILFPSPYLESRMNILVLSR